MINKLIIVCFFTLIKNVWAATFYVSQSGIASKSNATGYSTPMNVSTHNSATFDPGDIIYFLGTIGDRIIIPSSGNSISPIVYRGDYPGYIALLNHSSASTVGGVIDCRSRSYITFYNESTRAVITQNVTSFELEHSIDYSTNANATSVSISLSSNITFDNWEFKNGYKAINAGGSVGVTDITIKRCLITEHRFHGIRFTSDSSSNLVENIIIGGSAADGNEFYKNVFKLTFTGPTTPKLTGSDIYFARAKNIIISYNHIHGTEDNEKDGWTMTSMQIYGVEKAVIEYNTIHDAGAHSTRGGIHLKTFVGITRHNRDIIIRYNNIYNWIRDDENDGNYAYVGGSGIAATRNSYNLRIYGNRVHNVITGVGMDICGESNDIDGYDGYHINNIYIWGNVFSEIKRGAFSFSDGASSNKDIYHNIYVVNNTAAASLVYVHDPASGLLRVNYKHNSWDSLSSGDKVLYPHPHMHFYNNIFYEPMYGKEERFVSYIRSTTVNADWINYDHNAFYDSNDLENINWAWGDSYIVSSSTIYPFTSFYLSSGVVNTNGWNYNSIIPTDPFLVSPINGDVRIISNNSPTISSGKDMSGVIIPSITVPIYDSEPITFSFADILSQETTNWSAHPPVIGISDQSLLSSWGIGAYIYSHIENVQNPVITTAYINTSGTQLTIIFNQSVNGTAGFTITPSDSTATLSYSHGTGSNRTYNISRAIRNHETVTLSYSPGNIVSSSDELGLDIIIDALIVNNSLLAISVIGSMSKNKVISPIVNYVSYATIHGVMSTSLITDDTLPTVTDAVIQLSGEELIVNFDKSVVGYLGFSITPSGGEALLSYLSGIGSIRRYTIDRPIISSETVTLSYTPGDIEDVYGNLLYSIPSMLVINSSNVITGSECNNTPFRDVAASGTLQAHLAIDYMTTYWGHLIEEGSVDKNICKISFYIRKNAGNTSNHVYVVEAYTLTANFALDELIGQSNTITDFNSGDLTEITFEFYPAITIKAGDAIVLRRHNTTSSDPNNYISIRYVAGDNDNGYTDYARWRDNGAFGTSSSSNFVGKFYEYGIFM